MWNLALSLHPLRPSGYLHSLLLLSILFGRQSHIVLGPTHSRSFASKPEQASGCARLARVVKRCLDLPGYGLFQYVGDEGEKLSIDASDVNDYLREITGQPFTAKDFRTWAGTVLSCAMLRETEAFNSESKAKKNVVAAIKSVAAHLGNTPAVCRKCYVHRTVLQRYMDGDMLKSVEKTVEGEIAKAPSALRREDLDLLHLLEHTNHKTARAA